LLHNNRRIFFTNEKHLVKENPYLQNSSSVSSPSIQHHTTQQLSLISLKLFSISRRGKKKPKITHKDPSKQTRESSRTSDQDTASSQTQTRCLKNTTENKTQTKGKKEEEQQQQPNSTRRSPSPPLPRKIQKLRRW
jgi:hypothetical protein